ncbi:hypothetical protein KCU62_g79, partial [Aureobasidium sp. EXF-3399]
MIIWVAGFHMTCVEGRGRTLVPRNFMSGDAQEPHDRAEILMFLHFKPSSICPKREERLPFFFINCFRWVSCSKKGKDERQQCCMVLNQKRQKISKMQSRTRKGNAARSRFLTAWVAVAAALRSRMTFDDVLFQERSLSDFQKWSRGMLTAKVLTGAGMEWILLSRRYNDIVVLLELGTLLNVAGVARHDC